MNQQALSAVMERLTVLRPRGQRPETFYDSGIESVGYYDTTTKVQVYAYEVTPDHSLKVYAFKVPVQHERPNLDKVKVNEGYEVAHFRSNQWDTVRIGR